MWGAEGLFNRAVKHFLSVDIGQMKELRFTQFSRSFSGAPGLPFSPDERPF
jgi:hypothetical protein